jgi:phosphate transport system substrate-binding protein
VYQSTKENPLRSRTWLAPVAAAVLALGVSACGSDNNSSSGSASTTGGSGSSGASGSINGAGSTFAAPIYQQWGNALKDKGITVNYQPVGSGAGIAQLAAGTADFGASDPALTPEDRATFKKGEAVQIPMAFGAITVAYNLNGVDKGLKLDGATTADIFLGKVTKWNDPAIAKLNPGVKLPGDSITVVHRSDESGTTKGFTGFLAAYSPEWSSKVGSDKTVKWPVGTGAKGNDGVAAAVKQQSGAVGYVEEAYALQNNFTTAAVKNKAGKFVEPTLGSTTAAGQGVKVPKDLGINIIDSPNPASYPISSQTFVIVYKDLCKGGLDKGKAGAVKGFLDYGLGEGQGILGQLQYAKLPAALLTKSQAASDSLTCNGSPVTG